MTFELTPDQEAAFFSTGTLPDELFAQTHTPPAEPPAEPITPPADTPPPVAAVADSAAHPAPAAPDITAALADLRRTFESKIESLETQLTPKPAPVAVPDSTTDPLGRMIHDMGKLSETVAQLETKLTESQQQNLLKQQFEQFTGSVRSIKEAFEKTTPDFGAAYAHIRAVRTEDLRTMGVPETDIPKALLQDELQLAQAAIARGKNPAEEMYNMSKRYGFTGKSAPAAPTQTPAERIAALRAGEAAARSPARAGTDGALTIDGLKDAGNDDLNKLVQDDAAWNSLLGGKSGIFPL